MRAQWTYEAKRRRDGRTEGMSGEGDINKDVVWRRMKEVNYTAIVVICSCELQLLQIKALYKYLLLLYYIYSIVESAI